MSALLTQEFQARGVAKVLVFLDRSAAAKLPASASAAASGSGLSAKSSAALGSLVRHFSNAETSHASQLAVAARAGRALDVSSRTASRTSRRARAEAPGVRYYPNLGVLFGTTTRAGLAALRSSKGVKHVGGAPEISLIQPWAKAAATVTSKVTWGLESLRVPKLWAQGLTGKGILVGHLDTGVDGRHPALATAIAGFAEFDDMGRQVSPAPEPFDSGEHGTHTAATIAGRAVGGKHVGVAHGAMLASALVIEGGDVVARVLGGMDWAVGQRVRVLSMSLGLRGWWDEFLMLTQVLRAQNVLPVFAVGNEGPGTSRSPGNYGEALSVGAHDEQLVVADFSSSQRFTRKKDAVVPDLVAPGVGVISAKPGGGFQSMDGTSMATPHVAGLAALLMEAKPDKTVKEVEAALFESCELKPGMADDRANRGVPDAVRALELL